MSQPARSFDTLRYAKRLQKVGVPQAQAEVQAETLKELVDDKLATKEDLRALKEHMDYRFSEMQCKIDAIENRIVIKLGSMIVAGVFVLGAMIKLL